jgi:hypothetical protein
LTEAGLAPSQRARVHSLQRHLDTLAAQSAWVGGTHQRTSGKT